MKKFFLMIMAIVLIGNCAILNPIGLNSGRIKGDEAKSKIQETAILNDVLLSTAFFGSPTVSLLTILAPQLSGIDPGKYYLEKDVNKCISDLNSIGLLLLGQGITAALCDLQPADGYIMGKPLPKL